MKREEIKKSFDIDEQNIIKTEGLFKGEPIWTPYFYDCLKKNGGMIISDELGNGISGT